MGGKLSIIKQSSGGGPENDLKPSLLDFFKPSCLKTEERREVEVKEMPPKLKGITLEECLLDFPLKQGGELLHQPLRASSRVCPWVSRCPPLKVHAQFSITIPGEGICSQSMDFPPGFFEATDSICIERERRHGSGGLVSCLSKSQSDQKPHKSVSFRLPEEADVYYFYSPDHVERDTEFF